MNINIEPKEAKKTLNQISSKGKKLLKEVRKERKPSFDYSKLEKDVDEWYKNLPERLSIVFSDEKPLKSILKTLLPTRAIKYDQKGYIGLIEDVVKQIDMIKTMLPAKKNHWTQKLRISILIMIATVGAILATEIAITNFFKNSKINDLKADITRLEDNKRFLIEILHLTESDPKNNKLIKLTKKKATRILGGKISLRIKEITGKREKTRIEIKRAPFDGSLENIEAIGLYEGKSFTFQKKKYFIYAIEIKQDSVLLFFGRQIRASQTNSMAFNLAPTPEAETI